MTDWVSRDATHLGVDRIFTSPTATALYENLLAAFEKAAGAPVLANSYIVTAMIAAVQVTEPKLADAAVIERVLGALAVTEGKLGNGAVAQGKLKTTTGDVSTTSTSGVDLTLPGGDYGFYPQLFNSGAGNDSFWGASGSGVAAWTAKANDLTTPTALLFLAAEAGTAIARQRYIQASPPYDLGDGEAAMFAFALVDGTGRVIAAYAADDPPWAHNGPTDIKPDLIDAEGRAMKLVRPALQRERLGDELYRDEELAKLSAPAQLVELTAAVKNSDMGLIPHPFLGNDLSGLTVVLLDPVSAVTGKLRELHDAGESVCGLLHDDYVRLDNTPLNRRAPSGVTPVAAHWRRS